MPIETFRVFLELLRVVHLLLMALNEPTVRERIRDVLEKISELSQPTQRT